MLTIERCQNGWLIKDHLEEGVVQFVVEVEDDNEVDGYVKLLQTAVEAMCIYGSRYDEWRVHITKVHGDKWENPNVKAD